MALDFINVSISYSHLLHLLRVEEYGSAFRNLYALESLPASVTVARGDMDELRSCLASGIPLLAFVNTGQLRSYWSETTNHVVVVIGCEDNRVFLNDPYFAAGGRDVSEDEFQLAWLEQDYLYAVIERRP